MEQVSSSIERISG